MRNIRIRNQVDYKITSPSKDRFESKTRAYKSVEYLFGKEEADRVLMKSFSN